MNFTQSTPDRLFISLDPVGERAFFLTMVGLVSVQELYNLPSITAKDILIIAAMIGGMVALLWWGSSQIDFDFQRATSTLTVTKSLFRWSKHRTIPLADIKGVKTRNEDGGVELSLILQDANGDKPAHDLMVTTTSHREAKDLAQIITQWLETPSPA